MPHLRLKLQSSLQPLHYTLNIYLQYMLNIYFTNEIFTKFLLSIVILVKKYNIVISLPFIAIPRNFQNAYIITDAVPEFAS